MIAPALLTIDGYNYMSTKTAANLWNLNSKTVSEYCNSGKIKNKFKNGRFGWYIRTDEMKPLSEKEIRKILVLTLQLKNNPSYGIDWSLLEYDESAFERIYQQLFFRGYIESFTSIDKARIPYDVILTPKGMEVATSIKNAKTQNLYATVTEWLPIIISAAQLYFQLRPI